MPTKKQTKKKSFDCVEMKQRGQEALQERLKDLTPEQRIEFWADQARRMNEMLRAPSPKPQDSSLPQRKSA